MFLENLILYTKQLYVFASSNEMNNFQTPDSKKDKSLTPKTPKVPLSLEEIKAKMQASVEKVSFWNLRNGYVSLIAMLLPEYIDAEAQRNENLLWDKKKPLYSWEANTYFVFVFLQ